VPTPAARSPATDQDTRSEESHVSSDQLAAPDGGRACALRHPCGIYDPAEAVQAARTVARMVELIGQIPEGSTAVADRNKFVRCVTVKEQHAEKVKHEVQVIWSDYFKPEHLAAFPELHTKVWNLLKLAARTSRASTRRRRPTSRRRPRSSRRCSGRPRSSHPAGRAGPGVSGRPARARRRGQQPWRLRFFLFAAAILAFAWDAGALVRRARRGPWRVEVVGESMIPALEPGDWLLVDPTPARWPLRGTVVVVREPGSDFIVVKRIAGRPGDRIVRPDGPRPCSARPRRGS